MHPKDLVIPFNKPFIVGKELYYIAQAVLVNGHISGDGPFSKHCQEWLQKQLGCIKALLTHSCTAALEMAAILCDIQPGDEVIMASFTFVSTANAFVLRGGVPVFVDIRPDTLNIDETLIEAAISPRTRAIIPVHYAGVSCAMDEIMHVARRHGLYVVEDAAQALLSTYKGRYLGTIGHLGCLSFHETKNIISGEGGALLINDPKFCEQAEVIRDKGTNRAKFFRGEVDKYTWIDIGSSYLPSELASAFLYAQMEHAEKIHSVRCSIFAQYHQALRPLEEKGFLVLPKFAPDCDSNGHLYYIITKSLDERTRLIAFLKKRGIMAVFHYVPLHSSPAGRKYGKTPGDLPVTDDYSARILRLPIYYEMRNEDIEMIVDTINRFYSL